MTFVPIGSLPGCQRRFPPQPTPFSSALGTLATFPGTRCVLIDHTKTNQAPASWGFCKTREAQVT